MVTGASSGIGRAIAHALLADGMHVYLVGRDATRLNELTRCSPSRTTVVRADLATQQGIITVAKAAGARLHVLVHSAGAYLRAPATALSVAEWEHLDRLNLYAPAACRAALRATGGDVVFINSSAGLRPAKEVAAYAAGKHALHAASDALRQELNPDGIRVLSVFPGRTDTPMQRQVLQLEGRTPDPASLMRPEDVACMVIAVLKLPRSAEVTDIIMRPMRPLP
jgi:NADP-dependent 3-hydroxy acid dehydrogenase YdfG